jgi:hypothetical protein
MKPVLLTLIALAIIHPAAMAAITCTASLKEWQPREALRQKLEDDGWDVRAIKARNGCYEAHGVDATGAEVDAYFDPKSFTAIKATH